MSIFSKDLKLAFPTIYQQHENCCKSSSQEPAIYILQTIKVDKKLYSLYYDTGCCDIVSRYFIVIKFCESGLSREFNFVNQGKLCISREFNFANGQNQDLSFFLFLKKTIKIQHFISFINQILCSSHS